MPDLVRRGDLRGVQLDVQQRLLGGRSGLCGEDRRVLTDVRMDHYIEIDFSGFAKLVDALGGVTVTTDQNIDDDKSHLHLKAGTHHLGGTQALALARTRHGIGDGSDLGRIGLQQKLVKALLEQMASTSC